MIHKMVKKNEQVKIIYNKISKSDVRGFDTTATKCHL